MCSVGYIIRSSDGWMVPVVRKKCSLTEEIAFCVRGTILPKTKYILQYIVLFCIFALFWDFLRTLPGENVKIMFSLATRRRQASC